MEEVTELFHVIMYHCHCVILKGKLGKNVWIYCEDLEGAENGKDDKQHHSTLNSIRSHSFEINEGSRAKVHYVLQLAVGAQTDRAEIQLPLLL